MTDVIEPTDEEDVLAAYRKVTGWTDEDVLHYATCPTCEPDAGDSPYYCPDSPAVRRARQEQPTTRVYGEPATPQTPLGAALRREAERVMADAKARMPLHHGALRNSATPEALARIRAQAGAPGEIRFAIGGVIQRPHVTAAPPVPRCPSCGGHVELELPDGPVDCFSDTVRGVIHCPNGCLPPGGPYCGVCGALGVHEPLFIPEGHGFATVPGVLHCPNGCDPRNVSPMSDGIVPGRNGRPPYCDVCGTPAERSWVDVINADNVEAALAGPWSCPNGCDQNDTHSKER